MTPKQFYLTQEGLEKLKNELDQLKTVKRKEVADRIEKAKEMGDLSENAEYAEAKDEQAFMEGRISELTNILNNSVVSEGKSNGSVSLGSDVKVKINGEEKEYTVVGYNEADPLSGKISNESPLGQAFLHKNKGDKVTVTTPKGDVEYEILDIN